MIQYLNAKQFTELEFKNGFKFINSNIDEIDEYMKIINKFLWKSEYKLKFFITENRYNNLGLFDSYDNLCVTIVKSIYNVNMECVCPMYIRIFSKNNLFDDYNKKHFYYNWVVESNILKSNYNILYPISKNYTIKPYIGNFLPRVPNSKSISNLFYTISIQK